MKSMRSKTHLPSPFYRWSIIALFLTTFSIFSTSIAYAQTPQRVLIDDDANYKNIKLRKNDRHYFYPNSVLAKTFVHDQVTYDGIKLQPRSSVEFYPNGNIREAQLRENQEFVGLSIFGNVPGSSGGEVSFHENGVLKLGQLESEAQFDDGRIRVKKFAHIELDEEGKLRGILSGIGQATYFNIPVSTPILFRVDDREGVLGLSEYTLRSIKSIIAVSLKPTDPTGGEPKKFTVPAGTKVATDLKTGVPGLYSYTLQRTPYTNTKRFSYGGLSIPEDVGGECWVKDGFVEYCKAEKPVIVDGVVFLAGDQIDFDRYGNLN